MSRILRALSLLVLILLLPGGKTHAAYEPLAIDLAQDHVDITTGFDGAHIAFYGVKEQPGAVAVVITGPPRDAVVRRKSRLMGVWMNTEGITFEDVPSFYDFALDRPAEEMAPPKLFREQGIGMDALMFDPASRPGPEDLKDFQEALIRAKQKRKLFPSQPGKITYISDSFFKAEFYIPPYVPVGAYQVKAFLIQGGEVRSVRTTKLRVAQVGASASIHTFAHDWSFVYGLLCVIIAMFMGWLSNAIRKTG